MKDKLAGYLMAALAVGAMLLVIALGGLVSQVGAYSACPFPMVPADPPRRGSRNRGSLAFCLSSLAREQ